VTQGASSPGVHLEPWGPGDLHLLEQTMGDAEMTRYLGGPEDAEKLAERQDRYRDLAGTGTGRMCKVVDDASHEPAGSIGYWEKEWRDDTVWETGWFVLPAFQGRGIATAATRLVIAEVRAERRHRFLHAFPSVENAASNAVCRKVGFTLLEEAIDFEFPPGNLLRCNDWRLDVLATA
jgi:RimJ/RimL family protein N-acetyltransferase